MYQMHSSTLPNIHTLFTLNLMYGSSILQNHGKLVPGVQHKVIHQKRYVGIPATTRSLPLNAPHIIQRLLRVVFLLCIAIAFHVNFLKQVRDLRLELLCAHYLPALSFYFQPTFSIIPCKLISPAFICSLINIHFTIKPSTPPSLVLGEIFDASDLSVQ